MPWLGVVAAYLLGSICFGLLFAKRRGIDLRAIGSGNVGATNAGRALGKPTGRLVLLLDAGKGIVSTAVMSHVFDLGWPCALAGIACVAGHCWPVFFSFRGGKGAATTGGVFLGASPWVGVLVFLTFLAMKKWSRRASVGSLASGAVGVAGTAYVNLGTSTFVPMMGMAIGVFLIVVVRHRANIGRLFAGTEPTS